MYYIYYILYVLHIYVYIYIYIYMYIYVLHIYICKTKNCYYIYIYVKRRIASLKLAVLLALLMMDVNFPPVNQFRNGAVIWTALSSPSKTSSIQIISLPRIFKFVFFFYCDYLRFHASLFLCSIIPTLSKLFSFSLKTHLPSFNSNLKPDQVTTLPKMF